MKRRRKLLMRAALAVLALLAGLGLLVSSGIVSIAASSGHWPLMNWFLHYAAQRSIFTHSLNVQVPSLDDPAAIRLGAVHYRTQCATCHGAPGTEPSRLMQLMTPPPPPLSEGNLDWQPRELFWIVKHGIKYTAMPAWPSAQRDDDVWPVVAFLLKLPQLDERTYRQWSGWFEPLSVDGQARLTQDCAACHGARGEGKGEVPRLAGQSAAYLRASLDAYADGHRHSGMMEPLAAGLSPGARDRVAEHYSRMIAPSAQATNADAVRRGQRIAADGIPAQGIPPCAACHGTNDDPLNARYPLLDAQPREYIELQLRLFREGRRGGSSYGELMRTIAQRMNDEQSADAAAYFASRPPASVAD